MVAKYIKMWIIIMDLRMIYYNRIILWAIMAYKIIMFSMETT